MCLPAAATPVLLVSLRLQIRSKGGWLNSPIASRVVYSWTLYILPCRCFAQYPTALALTVHEQLSVWWLNARKTRLDSDGQRWNGEVDSRVERYGQSGVEKRGRRTHCINRGLGAPGLVELVAWLGGSWALKHRILLFDNPAPRLICHSMANHQQSACPKRPSQAFRNPPYSGDCCEFRFRSGSNTRALSSAAGVFKKMQMVTSTTITFALVLSKPNVAELEKHDYNLSRPLLTQRCAWVWEVILRLAGQWWISSCVEDYSTAAMHAHILGDHHKGLHFTSSKSLAIANRQYFYANYQHNLHSTILLIMCFQAHYNWQASFSSRLRCSTEYEY